jgi:hypothetical protein
MEGWRQRRPSSEENHSRSKGNYKTDLTLTGFLMEGLVSKGARNCYDSLVISKDTVVAMLHWQTKCPGNSETSSGDTEHGSALHFLTQTSLIARRNRYHEEASWSQIRCLRIG